MGNRSVVIVGAGFAGTALALFLRRAGLEPEVYEARSAAEAETGAFLYLAPNGMRVMRELGLEGALEADGLPTTGIVFYNARGRRIGGLDSRGDRERYGVQGRVVKREHVFRVLRDAALRQGIPVHFGRRLEELRLHPEGVTAVFQDGTPARGGVLVGADGINSRTRLLLFPGAPHPRYTGLMDTGGFAQVPALAVPSGPQHMIFGKRAFFAHVARPSGEVYWFSNVPWPQEPTHDELSRMTPGAWKERLLELHEDDPAPVQEIMRATPAEGLGRWPIREMPPLPAWHRGPVCLIGDAAHAASPSAGQGASTALEDAIVLAKCLRDLPTPEQAFALFQSLRKRRVEEIARQARRNGDRKIPHPAQAWLRDLLLATFLERGAQAVREVYGYQVDWGSGFGPWKTPSPSFGAARQSGSRGDPTPVRLCFACRGNYLPTVMVAFSGDFFSLVQHVRPRAAPLLWPRPRAWAGAR